MVDGAAYLSACSTACARPAAGSDERGANMPRRRRALVRHLRDQGRQVRGGRRNRGALLCRAARQLGLADAELPQQHDRARWPELRERFADVFASRTRAEWEAVFAGSDACVAPVLARARRRGIPTTPPAASFIERDGVLQPAPAPRFSRTPPEAGAPPHVSAPTREPCWPIMGWRQRRSTL